MNDQRLETPENTSISYRRRVVTAVVITLGFIGLLLLVYGTADVLLLLFISLLIAVVFRSLGNLLHERTSAPQNLSLAIVIFFFVVLLVIIILLIGPRLAAQFDQLTEQLPQSLTRVEDQLRQYRWGQQLMDEIPDNPNWERLFFGNNSNILTRVTGIVSSSLNIIANLILVFFTAIFFAVEPQTYVNGLAALVPPRRRDRAREILYTTGDTLAKWLLTRFISMIAIGVMTTLGLAILGMPLALTLGIIAGLAAFIPTFGPIIALVPAVLLGFLDSPQMALYVFLLYMLVQGVDNYLLTPLVVRFTIRMPPALIVAAQLIAGVVFGQLGLVLAAPLIVAIVTLVRMIYVEDFLERGETTGQQNFGQSQNENTA
jgi:predicted PurR-regulated permease PerM